jgi:predicted dehydrogenase
VARKFRVGIIGSTKRGDYGHGLDRAFEDVERFDVVAIADDNAEGLKAAGKRLKVDRQYADFRKLLAQEKPDIVSIGPRWLTDRVAMVQAAAGAGCHIYCEKPFAATLADADAMAEACRKARIKLAMAHQFRAVPPVRKALADLQAGKFGKLIRLTARPKDDERGGGEELIVHGTHLFDLMIACVGLPRWVSGHVTVGGRDITPKDRREGSEPVGPVAGDAVTAWFGFDNGVCGSFQSRAGLHRAGRALYGLLLECETASLLVRSPGDVFIYPAPLPQPEDAKAAWQKVWVEDWHFTAEHKPRPSSDWIHRGNQVLSRDLTEAVENDREPASGLESALRVTEMIQGVYTSHFAGGARLSLPLKERKHPLAADR